MPNFGIIKEVFASPEDVINDELENVIVEPAEDPTIPTEDEDSGEGGAGLVADISLGDTVEPDSTDIIWPIEDIELNEPAVAAEQYEPEPIVSNQALLPTLGAVQEGDRVIIALINGEATVIGTVGSGDAQNARIATIEQVAGDTNQYFWHTSTGTDTGAHITQIPQESFLTTPSGGNTLIRSNGMAVRDGLTELAKFTATGIQIGQDTQARLVQDYHSFQQISKEGTPYVYFSDLRDADGMANIVETFEVSSSRTLFNLTYPIEASTTTHPITITDDDVVVNAYVISSERQIRLITPADGEIVISYWTESEEVKAFTLGTRGTGKVGAMSYSEGIGNISSGRATHAEGYNTTATGDFAHAEGNTTRASGYSHAEGWGTYSAGSGGHAEGIDTIAGSIATHAEGYGTIAQGVHSHAAGRGTIAKGTVQTAIGKYNIQDNNDTYALILGNGSDDNNRSNALTIDWNGNITCGLVNGVDVTNISGGSLDPSTWIIEEYTFLDSESVSATNYKSGETVYTKTGYYPIGVVGFHSSTRYCVVTRCNIGEVAEGTCKLWWMISNWNSSARTCTAKAKILWIPVNGGGGGGGDLPSYTSADAGKALVVNSGGTAVEWANVGGGTTYTAGDHISITNNVISATYSNATTSSSGLMSSSDKKVTSAAYSDGFVSTLTLVNVGSNNYSTLLRKSNQLGTSWTTELLYIYPEIDSTHTSNAYVPSMKAVSDALALKQDNLPSISGNSGKVLAVNSGATGLEWVTQSGGGGTTYTAGNGLSLSNNEFSIDSSVVALQTDLFSGSYNDLTDKPTIPSYSAGTGISIVNGVISLNLTQAESEAF